jgi:hypothetical protein
LNGDWIFVNSINFRGMGSYSPNKKFFVSADMDGFGKILTVDIPSMRISRIINTEQEKAIRPIINDSGTIMFATHPKENELFSKSFVFDQSGKMLLNYSIKAYEYEVHLSDCGRYAVCSTCNNYDDEDDALKIFIFNLQNGTLISKWNPDTGMYPNSYSILHEELQIILIYDHGEYRYTFDGELLNKEQWSEVRLRVADGYTLERLAYEELEKVNPSSMEHKDFIKSLELFTAAVQKDITPYRKSTIYKKMGEIYLKIEMKS